MVIEKSIKEKNVDDIFSLMGSIKNTDQIERVLVKNGKLNISMLTRRR